MTTYDLTLSNVDHPMYETYIGGGLRVVTKRFNAANRNLAQNDIAQLIPVKNGDCVLNVVSRVVTVDAANTFDVGDGATVDGFVDGDTAEDLGYSLSSLAGAEGFAIPKVYAADDTIDLKSLGAAALDGAVIEVSALIWNLQVRG